VGSGSVSSANCINKVKTKQIAQKGNVKTLPTLHFKAQTPLSLSTIESTLGKSLVLKPRIKEAVLA
jgi:D-alanine-D-alanine ligase-like ATP-grasp enzyme